MSTNSMIVEKLKDGTYRYIYCHFDGYLDSVGKTLRTVFDTDSKVKELLDLGGCSGIAGAESLDGVVAYHRDRGEEFADNEAEIMETLEAILGYEFTYVWEDGKWTAYCGHKLLDW